MFTQTVKCSLLSHIIVYQSFYGALLTFSYFLLQGKVLCFARIGKVICKMFISNTFRRPCGKNNISGCISHKLFIQTVKCSFFCYIVVIKTLQTYVNRQEKKCVYCKCASIYKTRTLGPLHVIVTSYDTTYICHQI